MARGWYCTVVHIAYWANTESTREVQVAGTKPWYYGIGLKMSNSKKKDTYKIEARTILFTQATLTNSSVSFYLEQK